MQRTGRWYPLGAILLAALLALACSDADPTGPEAPIPSFAIAACAEWSCAIADCRNDPAIYGACCVASADDGEPGAPRPSCGTTPGSGDGSYPQTCDQLNEWYCYTAPGEDEEGHNYALCALCASCGFAIPPGCASP